MYGINVIGLKTSTSGGKVGGKESSMKVYTSRREDSEHEEGPGT